MMNLGAHHSLFDGNYNSKASHLSYTHTFREANRGADYLRKEATSSNRPLERSI
ncbi:hypothetical protein BVRB_8g197340 [Beta vulgaris subsp. vulgaris]|nr:hypothetical protein BVRB_8g197340 [Beta vulgaris subsp. vulgaris]